MDTATTRDAVHTGDRVSRTPLARSRTRALREQVGFALSSRTWSILVTLASVVALTVTSVGAAYGVTSVVSDLLYLPIVLAAYRYLWRGVAYDVALAVVYGALDATLSASSAEALLAFAGRAPMFTAAAIVVATLSASVRAADERMDRQHDLAAALERAATEEEALQAAIATLTEPRAVDAALVFLVDGQVVRLSAYAGVGEAFARDVSEFAVDSGAGMLLSTPEPHWDTYLALVAEACECDDDVRRAEGLVGAGVVPLSHDGESLGALAVASRSQYWIRPSVQTASELVATQLARSLSTLRASAEKARLYRSAADHNRRLKALLDSTKALTSTMAVDEVLRQTVHAAAEALDCPHCVLCEYDRLNDSLVYRAAVGRPAVLAGGPHAEDSDHGVDATTTLASLTGRHLKLEENGPYWHVLHDRAPVIDYLSDPDLDDITRRLMVRRGQRASLSVPVVYGDEVLGLFTVMESEYDRRFSEEDVDLANALAEQAAVALTNARLYEAVEARAVRDGLTGLYNHRYFYERLAQELARSQRYAEPLSLLMLDIDDFKVVNDRHGHTVGDEVLRAVAQTLGTQVRRGVDTAARYGGEELTLILPNTLADAKAGPAQLCLPDAELAGVKGRSEYPIDGHVAAPRAASAASSTRSAAVGAGSAAGTSNDSMHAAATAIAVAEEDPVPARPEGALAVAERVRAMIAASTYATDSVAGGVRITVSIGVAYRCRDAYLSPHDLVSRADEALYQAKHRGKDCVVLFGH